MAITVKRAAVGDSPNTGMPKSPPTKVIPKAPALREKDSGGEYGMNHFTGASSAPLNAIPQSPMAKNLAASSDDGEDLLSTIQQKGTAALGPDWQTREVSSQPFAPAHGMKGASAGPKIPDKLGASNGQPVRKPS